MDDDERQEIRSDFSEAVNMTPSELEDWLDTEKSKSVGEGEGESKGHRSGRRIIQIKQTPVDDLTGDDYSHMKRVVGYVARHLKQRPSGDVNDTDWAYSLKNWGHDPGK
jgi:hypothetical protein